MTMDTFDLIQASDLEKQFPVSARKLYSILCVGSEFMHWIRRRIEQYDLIPDQDYSTIVTNDDNLTNAVKDYMLTLDTAKELAMVENNETGRKVRRYFIEMEKLVKGRPEIIPNNIAQENAAAAVIVESQLKIGALLGAPQSLARAHAVTEVSKWFPRVNPRPLLVHNPEEQQELDLIPGGIARELGLKSAQKANSLLMKLGYQIKTDKEWELTEKGKSFGAYHKMAKAHSNGTPIQQIKWKKSILEQLREHAQVVID